MPEMIPAVAARRDRALGVGPGLSYLDGLWQLWDKPYQQCLHDKAARTVVVKVPRVNELRLAP